jgi:hypothetical protein
LLLDEELRAAHIRRPVNPIGIGWAGPTLMYAGTDEQKERWLWPLLSGEEFWCQLFSEPGAGSDLAALTTRAERDGDAADADWVVNGQKVWTSYAHIAKWGILLARTDPGAAKHSGISYFVCPMDAPGIEIRPLIDMTGEHAFNEVFFDDVRIPADHLMGDGADGRRSGRSDPEGGRRARSRVAGPPGLGVDGEPDLAGTAAANRFGGVGRQGARTRGVGAQGHRRRARATRDERRSRLGGAAGHVGGDGSGWWMGLQWRHVS